MLERRREGAVELLQLDRQAVRNALDAALAAELARALGDAQRDGQVRAVVLAGKGAGFCAGSDVKEMVRVTPERRLEIAREKAALLQAMAAAPKPVVAAVHGFALGSGLMLAAGCDVVVTESDARWRLPEVGLGFFPPWGLEALVARVGVSRARLLVFGHEPLDGARARAGAGGLLRGAGPSPGGGAGAGGAARRAAAGGGGGHQALLRPARRRRPTRPPGGRGLPAKPDYEVIRLSS